MAAPARVQLSRKKGWRMPQNTVKVARPTMYGNPWVIKNCGKWGPLVQGFGRNWYPSTPAVAQRFSVWMFRRWMISGFGQNRIDINRLRGKNLACWCALDQPCHADVLLKLANNTGD